MGGGFRWQGHKKSKEIIPTTHNENEARKKKERKRPGGEKERTPE